MEETVKSRRYYFNISREHLNFYRFNAELSDTQLSTIVETTGSPPTNSTKQMSILQGNCLNRPFQQLH
eukprot:snap_masked-scaffold_7-processed-gene-19.27-mRNA-1 protein AED:1.00 eAED:1.00 QI:0/-1/0/0/-1/1/1/0/67